VVKDLRNLLPCGGKDLLPPVALVAGTSKHRNAARPESGPWRCRRLRLFSGTIAPIAQF